MNIENTLENVFLYTPPNTPFISTLGTILSLSLVGLGLISFFFVLKTYSKGERSKEQFYLKLALASFHLALIATLKVNLLIALTILLILSVYFL